MWEYTVIKESREKKLIETLNELGKENWEVAGCIQVPAVMAGVAALVILKRQIQNPQQ